jgi:hypothetical protein
MSLRLNQICDSIQRPDYFIYNPLDSLLGDRANRSTIETVSRVVTQNEDRASWYLIMLIHADIKTR